ncbi:MAG: hypothetical protein U1E63_13115 [Burkholderiales bacterium]
MRIGKEQFRDLAKSGIVGLPDAAAWIRLASLARAGKERERFRVGIGPRKHRDRGIRMVLAQHRIERTAAVQLQRDDGAFAVGATAASGTPD